MQISLQVQMFSLSLKPPGNEQTWEASAKSSVCISEHRMKLHFGSNAQKHKSIWQDSHNSIYVDKVTSVQI